MTDTKCSDKVGEAFERRISAIDAMREPKQSDFYLVDDGTADTVIAWSYDSGLCERFSDTSEFRDASGELDTAALIDAEWMTFTDIVDDAFHNYGLSFDYVEPYTFGDDQHEGYHRYQLSCGGPSEEFRFYPNGTIEFWYLDWFDGACVNCSGDERAKALYHYFVECGLCVFAMHG